MSCKDLCVDTGYDGGTTFTRESVQRAAKSYHCCECASGIAKGESYHYVVGKTDGDFWSARTCLPCQEVRTTFCCDGWMISTLWEDVNDQVFRKWNAMTAIDCLARLKTDAAVAKMREQYALFRPVSSSPTPSDGTRQ